MGCWFFVRARGCVDKAGVDQVREDLKSVGRVYVSMLGTETDPEAGWFVVRSEAGTVMGLRNRLGKLNDRVDLVETMDRKEQGYALARQRSLFE